MTSNNPTASVNIGVIGAGFMGQLAHIANYAVGRNHCSIIEHPF